MGIPITDETVMQFFRLRGGATSWALIKDTWSRPTGAFVSHIRKLIDDGSLRADLHTVSI